MSTGIILSGASASDHNINHIIDFMLEESQHAENQLNSDQISRLRSQQQFVAPILNQIGSNACVAFSLTSSLMQYEQNSNLNPYFIYNMRSNHEADSGMSVRNALAIMYKYGVPSYRSYPVRSQVMEPHVKLQNHVMHSASHHRILGYGRIYDSATMAKLMRLQLSETKFNRSFLNPIVTINIYNSGAKFFRPKDPNLPRDPKNKWYHSLDIVGYSDGEFKVQNSWSDAWNNGGYTTMTLAEYDEFVIEAYYATKKTIICNYIRQFEGQGLNGFMDKNNVAPTNMSYIEQVGD